MSFINVSTLNKVINKQIYGYAKANNKYIKNYDKNKELRYLKYWNVKNLCLGNAAKAYSS